MKCLNFLIILISILSINFSVFAIRYNDLSSSHWAYKYVMDLSSKNVINGYADGRFLPAGTVTKAEFIKLVVMASLPEWIDIDDAESKINHWCGKYLWIAEQYGIVPNGSLNANNLNLPITRIEMVRIISKADITMKGNLLDSRKKVKFNDVISLNSSDMTLLKHAYSKGFITGYEDNSFKPNASMTRAEAATMIYRFM